MKNKNELKDLLDRLKGEVGGASAYGPARPKEASPDSFENAPRPERPRAPGRSGFQRPDDGPEGADIIWSENKETMLFGMLVSLLAILSGVLAGIGYLMLTGAVAFLLFALVTALMLFGHYMNFRREGPEDMSLTGKVDRISRRLELLSAEMLSGRPRSNTGAPVNDIELERKVEDLRILVKSLAQAVEEIGEDR